MLSAKSNQAMLIEIQLLPIQEICALVPKPPYSMTLKKKQKSLFYLTSPQTNHICVQQPSQLDSNQLLAWQVESQGISMNHEKNLLLNNKHTLIMMLGYITNMQMFTREPIISNNFHLESRQTLFK